MPDAIAPYTIELYLVFCEDVRFANPTASFSSVIAVSPSEEYVLADNENEFSSPLSFELWKNLCVAAKIYKIFYSCAVIYF